MGTDIPEIGRVVPSAFQRDHEGVGGAEVSDALVGILDLQEQQPAVVRLRDWARAVAAPQPGQTVVDVGAGTGTETQRLRRRARGRCSSCCGGYGANPDRTTRNTRAPTQTHATTSRSHSAIRHTFPRLPFTTRLPRTDPEHAAIREWV